MKQSPRGSDERRRAKVPHAAQTVKSRRSPRSDKQRSKRAISRTEWLLSAIVW